MPIARLRGQDGFPPAQSAGRDGLLAVGGDLSPRRLLCAYGRGIFPWYEQGQPILWWSPDPRFVLFPKEFHYGATLKKVLRRGDFTFTFDRDFAAVVAGCALPRPDQAGTWITPAMRDAYIGLHRLGYAHSLEAWHEGRLAGGLYGVSLGGVFFAESMFHLEANASKAVLATLAALALTLDLGVIDCQVPSPHLLAWGGRSISRRAYLRRLRAGLRQRTLRGDWDEMRLLPA
ncbi:MAG: leucyl/phenylalanyl-tRNA--protein transferase [Acidobacteria bacterium]|jgi:leucyl/phenylalanyl-tRNA--protein transferase|nr:leucyl/phenylalanyl-tRNA--protein transferase [Acidobacteriota bacterium]